MQFLFSFYALFQIYRRNVENNTKRTLLSPTQMHSRLTFCHTCFSSLSLLKELDILGQRLLLYATSMAFSQAPSSQEVTNYYLELQLMFPVRISTLFSIRVAGAVLGVLNIYKSGRSLIFSAACFLGAQNLPMQTYVALI